MAKEEVITIDDDEPEKPSFAKDEDGDEEIDNKPKEDLSMFERNLTLPNEGAVCLDSNIQASKYIMVYLMRRIQRSIATWWKFNVVISREEKMENWKKGYRPEMPGDEFPIKEIDPATGEPEILSAWEVLARLRKHLVTRA